MNVENIFNSITDVAYLQQIVSDSSDGENSMLEFKSIVDDPVSDQSKGKMKSMIAKEICAFLNSNDGILCLMTEQLIFIKIKNPLRSIVLMNFLEPQMLFSVG